MKIEETLLWITDHANLSDEKEYKESIRFVHSLGLKCDSVGWCELDLGRGDIDKLFEKMNLYAETHNALLRGNYWKEYNDFESEWYCLNEESGPDYTPNYVTVPDGNGGEIGIREFSAYRFPKFTAVVYNDPFYAVTEHFRNVCIKHKFSGVDFYWIRDTGKYDATQYFGLILKNGVSEFTCGCDLSYSRFTFSDRPKTKNKKTGSYTSIERYSKFKNIGGRLAELSKMFYDLHCYFPIQLPRDKMPETDFACNYIENSDLCGINYVFLRKRVVDALLSEKVIKKENVTPILLYDDFPKGFHKGKSETPRRPSPEVVEKLLQGYNHIKENPRPKRVVTEKDALKLFRQMKKSNKEDFTKALPAKIREQLESTPYKVLIPYYSVSDGAFLSDEYRFLTLDESKEETAEFLDMMEKEELLTDKPLGIAFVKCADGDTVILSEDGAVKRVSHEDYSIPESWNTLAEFMYDSFEDS